jgi:3',5'-cyclic AMP phosphodiesterase CpdA
MCVLFFRRLKTNQGKNIQSIHWPTNRRQRRVVSLGDLGAYGEAGTTASFELAKEYLDGFGLPYNLVTGNHDLEGMQQFDTGTC